MPGSISIQHVEESLSRAHILAVVGQAGMIISGFDFDYGADGTIHTVVEADDGGIQVDGYSLEFQMKACQNIVDNGSTINYAMKADAYNKLVRRNENKRNPQLLVLCHLPKERKHWVNIETSKLTLQKCLFYDKFVGRNLTSNTSSITITIPKSAVLDDKSLTSLMESIKADNYHA